MKLGLRRNLIGAAQFPYSIVVLAQVYVYIYIGSGTWFSFVQIGMAAIKLDLTLSSYDPNGLQGCDCICNICVLLYSSTMLTSP